MDKLVANDWLVKPVAGKAGIYESSDKKNKSARGMFDQSARREGEHIDGYADIDGEENRLR